MTPKDKDLCLIRTFYYICDMYEHILKHMCQRYSNNSKPRFSDEEILTIYLYVGSVLNITTVKGIYKFAKNHLLDWFPKLVSYQTFVYRLNRLVSAVQSLSEQLISSFKPADCQEDTVIVDSFPIMICCGRNRNGKVATEITDKGYNATREQFYCGLKLHLLAFRRQGNLPFPCRIALSSASECDLTTLKCELLTGLTGKNVFADKIYQDRAFWECQERVNGNILYSPVKAVKGTPMRQKQMDKAANDLFNHAVSSIREPIEAFFNWLNEKTGIQRASKCRSTCGLLLHIYGKIATAFIPRMLEYSFNY